MVVTSLMIIIAISTMCFQIVIFMSARQERQTARMLQETIQQMSRFQPNGKYLVKFMFHKSAGFK